MSIRSPTVPGRLPRRQVERPVRALIGQRERDDRVGDVGHRHDVDGRRAPDRDHLQRAAREHAQRRVDDVERGRPAAVVLADDDARAQHLDRQVAGVLAHESLGLVLGLLVGVVELLADVEVALVEDAVVAAGDVRRRHVREPLETAVALAAMREVEHAPRPLDVDRARLVERQRELDRRGRVDDRADPAGDRLGLPGAHAEPGPRQVARHRGDALGGGARVVDDPLEHRLQPCVGFLLVVRAHERPDAAITALHDPCENRHPEETGRTSKEYVARSHRRRFLPDSQFLISPGAEIAVLRPDIRSIRVAA